MTQIPGDCSTARWLHREGLARAGPDVQAPRCVVGFVPEAWQCRHLKRIEKPEISGKRMVAGKYIYSQVDQWEYQHEYGNLSILK